MLTIALLVYIFIGLVWASYNIQLAIAARVDKGFVFWIVVVVSLVIQTALWPIMIAGAVLAGIILARGEF